MALVVVEEEGRVEVAVAGVGHGGQADTVFQPELVEPVDHLRDLRDGHRDVLAEHVLAQRHQDVTELAARPPDPVSLGPALGHAVVHPAHQLHHLGQLEQDLFLVVAVLLDQ